MSSFGDRLRKARKDARLSQEALAKKTGLSQTTISDIERGRNAGSTETASLATALNVDAHWLAEGGRFDPLPEVSFAGNLAAISKDDAMECLSTAGLCA